MPSNSLLVNFTFTLIDEQKTMSFKFYVYKIRERAFIITEYLQ